MRVNLMGLSKEYTQYVLEHLTTVFSVQTSRFFGGLGIYYESVQFGMIMDSALYFVVDENSRKKYEQAGMLPFSYMTKKGEVKVRKYFEVPEDILTDPELLLLWVNESVAAAIKAKTPKRRLNGGF